jgi:hypothetical protein
MSYDDEGNNYNQYVDLVKLRGEVALRTLTFSKLRYQERALFAMIPLTGNDTTRRLTFHDSQGTYPGMAVSRQFRIVIAGDGPDRHGSMEAAQPRTVLYDDRETNVDLRS